MIVCVQGACRYASIGKGPVAGREKGESMDRQESVGRGVPFERIRRITGYLVGTTDRFNNAKHAEERDRVKHCGMEPFVPRP